jgi:hypothetical protein
MLLLRHHPPGHPPWLVPLRQGAIGAFIDTWNQNAKPFAWTKDADEILGKIERAKTKTKVLTDH